MSWSGIWVHNTGMPLKTTCSDKTHRAKPDILTSRRVAGGPRFHCLQFLSRKAISIYIIRVFNIIILWVRTFCTFTVHSRFFYAYFADSCAHMIRASTFQSYFGLFCIKILRKQLFIFVYSRPESIFRSIL